MSYAHTKRRKTIKRLKKQWPQRWPFKFQSHCEDVRRQLLGPCTGTLEDIMARLKGIEL